MPGRSEMRVRGDVGTVRNCILEESTCGIITVQQQPMDGNWPLPDTDIPDIPIDNNRIEVSDTPIGGWDRYPDVPTEGFFPKGPEGWNNPWPDLPDPDLPRREVDLRLVRLSKGLSPCDFNAALGYYLPWHNVALSFRNERGRPAHDIHELRAYNASLPEYNRYGIHICSRAILGYIDSFKVTGLPSEQVPLYQEYCTYLTLVYVLAHEWGHYRTEVLSFQLSNIARSMTGSTHPGSRPSYLAYFQDSIRHNLDDFEEVFAEWAALKFGVFNYYIPTPAFAQSLPNGSVVEATLRRMLTEAMSRPTRIRPYSDIRHWVDFPRICREDVLKRVVQKKKTQNRSVNDSLIELGIQSLKKGKLIDLLMHNLVQFTPSRSFHGIVRSFRQRHTTTPDSIFYHMGDDDCLLLRDVSENSRRFLELNYGFMNWKRPSGKEYLDRVIHTLQSNRGRCILPLRTFPEILPLDPVYFHN
jgi:hypothetical protein